MAKIRVGINGFGRIGRNFLRAHLARGGDFDVVAVNDLADPEVLAHLLRYDSTPGRPPSRLRMDNNGIKTGSMTTNHPYTTEQQLQDQVATTRKGKPDLRRMRSAALNIVPASTGAARAIGEVIPELKGKLDGMAMRVPVPDGSVTDLVCNLEKPATADELNATFKEAAASDHWEGILQYTEDPIVSSDIIGNSY